MTIESLIEELEQIIDEGKSVPFTSNQIVDVERLRTTIEDMRLNMPAKHRRGDYYRGKEKGR